MSRRDDLTRLAARIGGALRHARRLVGPGSPTSGSRPSRPATPPEPRAGVRPIPGNPGPVDVAYRPRADGHPDPGEIVWAWVPFDENDGRGKDRPVLVIGRRAGDLLGLQLTSKDHDRNAADEARQGRAWLDIGSGPWDPRGRPSEVRLDRLLLLDPRGVRREGAALARDLFDRVIGAARQAQGW